jgi:hypothetical protein
MQKSNTKNDITEVKAFLMIAVFMLIDFTHKTSDCF